LLSDGQAGEAWVILQTPCPLEEGGALNRKIPARYIASDIYVEDLILALV
jgi:hypothetical protein